MNRYPGDKLSGDSLEARIVEMERLLQEIRADFDSMNEGGGKRLLDLRQQIEALRCELKGME